MTAKDVQIRVIQNYLKPLLKSYGYKLKGQTWWKEKPEIYTLINLQNYSWNSKDKVDFCFNIGPVVKEEGIKAPTVHHLSVYLREGFYLPEGRKIYSYRNNTGYTLVGGVEESQLTAAIKIDFEHYILPFLEKLDTLDDCLKEFGDLPFWGENLKLIIARSKVI